jgi:hypothetical protein
MTIGSTFDQELAAVGLRGLDISWFPETGELNFGPLVTNEQKQSAEAVLAAHDPMNGLKERKRREIEKWRDAAINQGTAWNEYVWDTDTVSRANLNAVLTIAQLGIPLPEGFTWRTKDNQNIPMTLPDLAALAATMMQAGNAAYVKSWQLKAQLDAATTEAEILAVEW